MTRFVLSLPSSQGTPLTLPLPLQDLSLNQLSGPPVPEAWAAAGGFPRLRVLQLSHNNFTGGFPEALGRGNASFPELQSM